MTQMLRPDELPEVNSERWLSIESLPGEEWRPVPCYEGMYEVSNYGRVHSLDRVVPFQKGGYKHIKGKVMRCVVNGYGYYVVTLFKESKGYFVGVHILIGRAFIPNPKNLPQINHKDENKKNNHISNLEWCTCQYNNSYGTKIERIKLAQRNDPRKSCPVMQYSYDNVFIKEYPSAIEAERQTGINAGSILAVCQQEKHCFSAGGFKWKAKSDPTPIEDFHKPKLFIRVKEVFQYTEDGEFVASYKNAKEAQRQTGVWSCQILRCARGVRGVKRAGGYVWKFS